MYWFLQEISYRMKRTVPVIYLKTAKNINCILKVVFQSFRRTINYSV